MKKLGNNFSKNKSNYIYGRNSALESLINNKVLKVYLQNGFSDNRILEIVKKNNLNVSYLDIAKMNEMVRGSNHQGVILEVEEFKYSSVEEIIKNSKNNKLPLILILDEVEDPHNFGAILRSCDAFSVDGVIIKSRNQVPLNMTVAKVSTGAVNYVKVAMVANLSSAIEKLKDNGFWIYAAEGSGKDEYQNVKFDRPTALIVGSEGKGISKLILDKSDFIIKIPMTGHVNSLNVSVSTGILLSRIRNN